MDLALQIRGDFSTVRSITAFAESEGLAAVALPDHYLQPTSRPASQVSHSGRDAFAQLAALAATTTTIDLAVLVAPITFRHPAVLLKMAVTIDEVSGGRFRLGIGTGWLESEHRAFGISYPTLDERYAMLEESIRYIRAAHDGRGFSGQHFAIEPFEPQPRPQRLPIIVGGTGPLRTPALAGRLADEYNAYVQRPEAMTARLTRARDAARAADRPNPMFSTASAIVTGANNAEYRANLAAFAAVRGISTDEVVAALDDQGIPHGPPQAVRETLSALEQVGIERYYIQLLGNATLERAAAIISVLRD